MTALPIRISVTDVQRNDVIVLGGLDYRVTDVLVTTKGNVRVSAVNDKDPADVWFDNQAQIIVTRPAKRWRISFETESEVVANDWRRTKTGFLTDNVTIEEL